MTFESFIEVYFNDKINSIKSSTERNEKNNEPAYSLIFQKV